MPTPVRSLRHQQPCFFDMPPPKSQPLLIYESGADPPPTIGAANKRLSKLCGSRRNHIKCVIVGDQRVGKTCLLFSYSTHKLPEDYKPTAYDIYNVEVQVDQKPIRLELCDTAGEDSFVPLRDLSYSGADVFILCFSVVKPSSYKSACERWANELGRFNATVVLVGTQIDLRDDVRTLYELQCNYQKPISTSEGKALAERLNAPYVETSASADIGLKDAFDAAITAAFLRKRRKGWIRSNLCCF